MRIPSLYWYLLFISFVFFFYFCASFKERLSEKLSSCFNILVKRNDIMKNIEAMKIESEKTKKCDDVTNEKPSKSDLQLQSLMWNFVKLWKIRKKSCFQYSLMNMCLSNQLKSFITNLFSMSSKLCELNRQSKVIQNFVVWNNVENAFLRLSSKFSELPGNEVIFLNSWRNISEMKNPFLNILTILIKPLNWTFNLKLITFVWVFANCFWKIKF